MTSLAINLTTPESIMLQSAADAAGEPSIESWAKARLLTQAMVDIQSAGPISDDDLWAGEDRKNTATQPRV